MKQQKRQLDDALALPETYADKNKFVETETAHKRVSEELKQLEKEYEQVFEKLMELDSN